MSEIHCPKCGEPWDTYHVRHDVPPHETERFLKGDGCWSCDWGTKCTNCSGTGREPDDNRHDPNRCFCFGEHFIIARLVESNGFPFHTAIEAGIGRKLAVGDRPVKIVPSRFCIHTGYFPKMRTLTKEERGKAEILKIYGLKQCREGFYFEVKLRCPWCEGQPCTVCGGTGNLKVESTDKSEMFKVASDLMGCDIDGLQSILEDMG